MRKRLVSALIFVFVLRAFPSHREISAFLRYLLGLFVLLLVIAASVPAAAKPMPGLNDYGNLIDPAKFSSHCPLADPGISGSATTLAYTRGEVSCTDLQALYDATYRDAKEFLSTEMHYNISNKPSPKKLVLRVLRLDELNNPDNFSGTDRRCMFNPRCSSGGYYGRTFWADDTTNINSYVVFSRLKGIHKPYDFESSVRHELMHVLLRVQLLSLVLDDTEEHTLIARFLHWIDRRQAVRAAR